MVCVMKTSILLYEDTPEYDFGYSLFGVGNSVEWLPRPG